MKVDQVVLQCMIGEVFAVVLYYALPCGKPDMAGFVLQYGACNARGRMTGHSILAFHKVGVNAFRYQERKVSRGCLALCPERCRKEQKEEDSECGTFHRST